MDAHQHPKGANWQMTSLLTCFWGNSTCGWWNSTSRSLSAPVSLSNPRTGTCSSGRPWLSDCVWGLGLMSPAESHSAGTKPWYLSGRETHMCNYWRAVCVCGGWCPRQTLKIPPMSVLSTVELVYLIPDMFSKRQYLVETSTKLRQAPQCICQLKFTFCCCRLIAWILQWIHIRATHCVHPGVAITRMSTHHCHSHYFDILSQKQLW